MNGCTNIKLQLILLCIKDTLLCCKTMHFLVCNHFSANGISQLTHDQMKLMCKFYVLCTKMQIYIVVNFSEMVEQAGKNSLNTYFFFKIKNNSLK